jgi:hypothetical protein
MPNYQFGGGGPFFPNGGYGFNGFGAGFGGDYYGPGSQFGFDPNVASPAASTTTLATQATPTTTITSPLPARKTLTRGIRQPTME